MPPHGPGMSGATHSHSVEYPDDNWNLYSMMDTEAVTALNVTRAADAVGIFKPFAHRHSEEPELISDSDEEIIVSYVLPKCSSDVIAMEVDCGLECCDSVNHCISFITITYTGNGEVYFTRSFTQDNDNRWWYGVAAPVIVEMFS